jgi:inositol-phosphate phosphatase/L-galactose 1-phosphate phosphatase/histidinol-phosphatase
MIDAADLAAFAENLADAARGVCLHHFRTAFAVEGKADASPVTVADRAAEQAMRAAIEAAYPDHGVYGEEFGPVRTDARFVWVLDPIDGTASFVTGRPTFGTLIACLDGGVPVAGVIDMPALDERWTGAAGAPTTFNGTPARARACADIADAWMGATSPAMFQGANEARFDRLAAAVRRTVWGGDCHGYGLLASGHLDLVCEADMQPYDYLALVPVIEGAGGRCTDWSGRPLGLTSPGDVVAAGDPALHEQAVALLGV